MILVNSENTREGAKIKFFDEYEQEIFGDHDGTDENNYKHFTVYHAIISLLIYISCLIIIILTVGFFKRQYFINFIVNFTYAFISFVFCFPILISYINLIIKCYMQKD